MQKTKAKNSEKNKTSKKLKKVSKSFVSSFAVPEEYEKVVEFSFIAKQNKFVVRFLNGDSYALSICNLPPNLQQKVNWEETFLDKDKTTLVVKNKRSFIKIPSYIVHAKGILIK